jgi:[acyl-carrier-protein] S-malonyltransferase
VSLALLFSPQGSQAVGMGHELADAWPSARVVFDEADGALGWSVSTVAWHGPRERLDDTRQTQPCIVATSLAAYSALGEASEAAGLMLAPAAVAGHSVGEYAALAASGVLSVTDSVRLVGLRARLMADAAVEGGMVAVMGLDRDRVAGVVDRFDPEELVLANDNAPGQVVISGTADALARAQTQLVEAGARRVIALRVSGPFHSPLMAPVGAALAEAFDGVTWSDADPSMVSNVTGQAVSRAAEIRDLLARQVSSPVEWVAGVRAMATNGVDTFIECGPGTALTGMVRRILPEAQTFNVSDPATLQSTIAGLQELAVGSPAWASV